MAKTTRILELSKTLPHGPNRVATQPWKGPTQFGHKVSVSRPHIEASHNMLPIIDCGILSSD